MQTPEPEKKNLFREIQRGDKRIRRAHKKAIILVGLTRIGKSTTFNWILKNPMKGKGKLISNYINSVDDESIAKVGSSFTSVTLAPNVHVNYQEGISLFDMAGYEDNRDYVGVIGVSYFLKALFEQVRQAKFVIVFDENKFFEQNASGLVRTFNGFINMFHYKEMPEDIKNKLKSSISVVITKSKKEHEHFEYLDEVTQKLRDQQLHIQNKKEVLELLDYVRYSARVHPFKSAKDNCNPEECGFIENFSKNKGWNFFNIDEAQTAMSKSPISLPFNRDFNKLEQAQKMEFTNAIEKRVSSYVGFSQIIKVLISNFSDNWTQFINLWKEQRKAVPNYFKMKPTFDKIREFVQANDVYDSKESIQTKFRVNYEPMTLVKSIKEIMSIFDFVSKIGTVQGPETFEEAMNLFSEQFSALVQCLKGFASENQEQELLQRLKYILIRGFRQFSKLYQLNDACIIDAKQNLRDYCNLVFEINQGEFIQKFVTEFNSDLLISIFPTIESLQEYEQFFSDFEQGYEGQKSVVFFSEQRCNIEMAKADLLVAAGERAKALLCYINALKNLSEISVCVAQEQKQNKEDELNKLSMKKLKLIRKIVNILKLLPESENKNYKRYALWLCQRHRMIQDSFQIYQAMIDSPLTSVVEKLQIYDEYARQCAKWGNVDRGIQLLQKKLVLQEQNFEDYCGTWAAIKSLAVNREQFNRDFIASLSETKRIPEADSELDMQLEEIKIFVQI